MRRYRIRLSPLWAKSGGGSRGGGGGGGGGGGELTGAQTDALQNYSGAEFKEINPKLRESGKLTKAQQKTVDTLDNALSQKLSPQALYRAGSVKDINNALNRGEDIVGKTFTEKAYTSTSKNKDAARNFLRSDNSRMYIINTGKKGRGRDISDIAQFKAKGKAKGEQEVLLKRNTTFKATKIEKVKEKYTKGDGSRGTRTVEYIHLDIV